MAPRPKPGAALLTLCAWRHPRTQPGNFSQDIQAVQNQLAAQIGQVKSEVGHMRQEMRQEMSQLRKEMREIMACISQLMNASETRTAAKK
eukprot:COSAG01_NODE_1556_length_9940_cov_13.610337_14_plen_90_part_00